MTPCKPNANSIISVATVILFGFLALLSFGQLGNAGLPGMKCEPAYTKGACVEESSCNFTDPNNIFYLACDSDCKANHNAKDGKCTKHDYCTCGQYLRSVNTISLQCLDIKQAEFWENVCHEDCQCAHNAKGGGCNFYTKGCECGEIVDKNTTNQCPHKTSNEYFINLIVKYKSVGIDIVTIFNAPT